MSELFDLDSDLDETNLDLDDEIVTVQLEKKGGTSARNRLEKMLEERRLREELEDFMDED